MIKLSIFCRGIKSYLSIKLITKILFLYKKSVLAACECSFGIIHFPFCMQVVLGKDLTAAYKIVYGCTSTLSRSTNFAARNQQNNVEQCAFPC